MQQRRMPSSWLVLILCAALSGCVSVTPPQSVDMLPSTHWARDSAEHDAIYREVYEWAGNRLEQMVAEKAEGTWAVSLDADETVLDNSLYQKERWNTLTSNWRRWAKEPTFDVYSSDSWQAWVERREALALPGAIEFLNKVRELGGVIAIVTNRNTQQCADTEENFRSEGIPYDLMLCKSDTSEKEARWESVLDGTASPDYGPLELVMWLGDNIEDFPDETQELRFGDDKDFAPFGRIYFNVPNPMYGSWTDNPKD